MSELSNENPNKKQRLGRGLGSLLGGHQDALQKSEPAPAPQKVDTQKPAAAAPAPVASVPAEARIWQVPVTKLSPSEFQPRSHFEKEKLQELADSIKQNGILQPIVARQLALGKFEIIAGERRWRAAQLAGLHEVPVILKVLENQAALELAIIENIQREDLNPIEEAEAYQRLADEFKLTQQQVADKVGKDRATIANSLRLLALPVSIREMVIQSQITAGHAKVLLGLQAPSQQLELARKIAAEKISVRQLEKLVASENSKKQETSSSSPAVETTGITQKLINSLAEDLQKNLGTKVAIDYANSKGRISIHFYSDAELTQIVERLKESHGRH